MWSSLSLLQGVSYSLFHVLWLSCQPFLSRHHQVWAFLVWAELAVQEAKLRLFCSGKGQLFPFHLYAGMKWQIYAMPIKIFCMVFNLSILAETIIHLICLYNLNIQYMAASPLTEMLFFITQTLMLHIMLVLPFLSYQSHFLHGQDVRNMIYWFCLSVHCRWSQTRYHCWMDKRQGHWFLYLL